MPPELAANSAQPTPKRLIRQGVDGTTGLGGITADSPDNAGGDPPIYAVRGLTKRWLARRADAPTLGGRSLVDRILAARGYTQPADIAAFLDPSLKGMHDPDLMPGLRVAAERILAAANGGEAIVIYGDYDVDGISASAILYHTILHVAPGAKLKCYVPHRIEEGYGLNAEAIAKLAADGARVIVSVDCGVTAVHPAQVAGASGVDLIITDHHTPPPTKDELPSAFAIVHPKLPGCESPYPFPELSGSAVAFKLAWRLSTLAAGTERVSAATRALLLDMLALASLGVVADVVPLVGENRIIARHGLSRLKTTGIPGIHALIDASGLGNDKIGAEDVGFRLAPRLNACGRMGHAREAVELLTTARGERAKSLAEELSRQNDLRRATERRIFEQACALAEERGMTSADHPAIVLAHAEWHQGVVGIVCSRLVERFARPVLLMQDHGDHCHGSGRSVDGVALVDVLRDCSSHLSTFGGHDMAAGLKLSSSGIDAFRSAFVDCCRRALKDRELIASERYDTDATLDELTLDAVTRLGALAPFGRSNPSVCVRLRGVRIAGQAQRLGSDGKHLSMHIAAEGRLERAWRCVAWNWGDRVADIPAGASIEALITPKASEWNGQRRVELELRDLKF